MPLESAASWKELAPEPVLDVIRRGLAPATWDECRDTQWERVLEFYCDQNYCLEHLKFLWSVREFSVKPSVTMAEYIIEEIVYGNPPLNLYLESCAPIDDWYKDEDHQLDRRLFDKATGEVHDIFSGTYQIFQAAVRATHDSLRQEASERAD